MAKRKCVVCGINWVVSENADNICPECFKTFNMTGSKKINSASSKWQGRRWV